MSAEHMMRDLLSDRFDEDRRPPRRRHRRLEPSESARLLDATAAVLAAMRNLIAVGEEILRERRDKVRDDHDDERSAEPPRAKTRIDLTY